MEGTLSEVQIPADHAGIHLFHDLPGIVFSSDVQAVAGLHITIQLVIGNEPCLPNSPLHDLYICQKPIFHLYSTPSL